MASYYLSPIGNSPQTLTSGAPLNGGFIYTYQAGTSTPQATYTDNTGVTPQANPIVLNTYGLPSSPIWLTGGQSYKFQIKDSAGNLIRTVDTVTGVNDFTTVQSGAVSYLTGVAGTNTITASLSGLSAYTAGESFLFIPAGSNTGAATLNINGLGAKNIFRAGSAVAAGALASGAPVQVMYDGTQFQVTSPVNPGPTFGAYQSVTQSVSNNTATKIQFQSEEFDYGNAFDSTTNYRFQPTVAGVYLIDATVSCTGMSAVYIYKNGVEFKRGTQNATVQVAGSASGLISLNGSSDYIEIYALQTSGGSQSTNTGANITFVSGCLVRPA